MEPEKSPSSPPRTSPWPLGLLGILAVFALSSWLKVKLVNANAKEKKPSEHETNIDNPLAPTVTYKMQTIEPNAGNKNPKKKRNKPLKWLTFGVNFLALLAVAYYACEAQKQRVAMEQTVTEVRRQADLMQQQVVGTMAAIVIFQPGIAGDLGDKLNVDLKNDGHVISSNAHIAFHWGVARLSSPDRFIREGHYSDTIPQLIYQGNVGKLVNLGVTIGHEFSKQTYTVKIEGEYDFNKGFDNRTFHNFCMIYLGGGQTRMEPDQNISTFTEGFGECGDFTERIKYIKSHPAK